MFRKVDLGREISGAEFGAMLERVAEEQGGKYSALVTKGEEILVLGSVRTEQRGGTLQPQIEVPYTAMRGRLVQSKKVFCTFGKDALKYYLEIASLGKDSRYKTVGLTVSVALKPIGLGRAIAWIPVLGWMWALCLCDSSIRLCRFSPERQAQVENDVVYPLLSRIGDLLKSPTSQPSSA